MRILTWNINGLRTLPQYYPWNTFKSLEGILEELSAEIICFQEIKTTRTNITRPIALPGPYDAFFSFPHSRHGYSGVAVFTDSNTCIPLKAEEGISGLLGAKHMKPPLSDSEKISPTYPTADDIDLMPDEQGNTPIDLLELDTEGRALMLDFGLFVLVNLYCPNETSDARLPYKMNFHRLLLERVRRLIEVEGREVIVVGDINVCAAPIDHVEGELGSVVGEDGEWEGEGEGEVEGGGSEGEDGKKSGGGFWAHPARKWFRDWLAPRGPMHDVVRGCWPDRKGMFTCWNTKISARASNYGTRIDYILLSKGLLPWFKHGDIMPAIKGSDHCPVYIDLHDEIETSEGKKTLREELRMGNVRTDGEGPSCEEGRRMPPRLSARHWDEFSGKQKLLSSFFGKKTEVPASMSTEAGIAANSSASPSASGGTFNLPLRAEDTLIFHDGDLEEVSATSSVMAPPSSSQTYPSSSQTTEPSQVSVPPSHSVPTAGPSRSSPGRPPSPASASSSKSALYPSISTASKRKKPIADSNYSSSSKKTKTTKPAEAGAKKSSKSDGQAKLSAFFTGGGASASKGSKYPVSSKKRQKQAEVEAEVESKETQEDTTPIDVDELVSEDEAFRAFTRNKASAPAASSKTPTPESSDAPIVWSQLFTKVTPPRCIVHGEPAMKLTVTKQGPNKGKMFYLCSRPIGPGYDAGKSVRPREEVNPAYRCNFFKWASEVRKEAMREGRVLGK